MAHPVFDESVIESRIVHPGARASEVRNFDGKMQEITFRILIAINGITGRNERKDAKGVIRDARKLNRQIVVLDKRDLEDISQGISPAEKINMKFYEIFKL